MKAPAEKIAEYQQTCTDSLSDSTIVAANPIVIQLFEMSFNQVGLCQASCACTLSFMSSSRLAAPAAASRMLAPSGWTMKRA